MIITTEHTLFLDTEKFSDFENKTSTSLTIPSDAKPDMLRGDYVKVFELRYFAPTGKSAECEVSAAENLGNRIRYHFKVLSVGIES